MEETGRETRLNEIQQQAQAQIEAGRTPGVVHWQAALASMLTTVSAHLVPGDIIPAASMGDGAAQRFEALQARLDFSPFVCGVFLPPELADTLSPAKIAPPLVRAEKGSMKILVVRVGDFRRILTAEIAPGRPGIDIFEDGSLLGSYEYDTPEDCMDDLSKVVWIHLKHQGAWSAEDCIRYTENWFTKSLALQDRDLPVNPNHSYIHSPTLLKLRPVDAVFQLMESTLADITGDAETVIAWADTAARQEGAAAPVTRGGLVRKNGDDLHALERCLEERLLTLLQWLNGFDIVDFKAFVDADQEVFKARFGQAVKDAAERFIGALG
jgi:hypothetical protein